MTADSTPAEVVKHCNERLKELHAKRHELDTEEAALVSLRNHAQREISQKFLATLVDPDAGRAGLCKSCSRKIGFYTTIKGGDMPCDLDPATWMPIGPHWATCPTAHIHRKAKG